jgi:DNA polymerase eta
MAQNNCFACKKRLDLEILHIVTGSLDLGDIGYEAARSKQAPFPFTKKVTVDTIASSGDKLWSQLVGNNSGPMKVSSIQLAFTGIETQEVGQQNIDGFFNGAASSNLSPKKVTKPSSKKTFKPTSKRALSAEAEVGTVNARDKRPKLVHSREGSRSPTESPAQGSSSGNEQSFICPRCNKSVSLDAAIIPALHTKNERSEALKILRQEHDDFHFAQDLSTQRSDDGPSIISIRSPEAEKVSKKAKKKRKEPVGLEKFFNYK